MLILTQNILIIKKPITAEMYEQIYPLKASLTAYVISDFNIFFGGYICKVLSAVRIYWLLQIVGWSMYGGLLAFFTYITKNELFTTPLLLGIASYVVIAIFLTHLMRDFFLKKDWLRLNLVPVIPRIIFLSAATGAIITIGSRTMNFFINSLFDGVDLFNLDRIVIDLIANSILVVFWNAIYFGYTFFKKYYYQEINNLTIESSLREVELKNLRSQLNPHFLFNSLNSIKALIEIDPNKAKESVTVLSSILRSSLVIGHEGLISLSKEIELVENYLKLEKIRFEERLFIEWDIQCDTDDIKVPPFILQMMVENAVKHGISNLVKGGKISITAKHDNQGVTILVKNTGQIFKNEETFGIGLENTKRRLDLQYQNRASLLMYEEEDMVVSQILLKD